MARLAARLVLAVLLLATVACSGAGSTAQPSPSPSTSAAPSADAPPPSPPPPPAQPPDEVARSWIAALAAADTDTAWELLSDAARTAVGGRDGFEQLRTALAEGWGSWDAADPQTTFLQVPPRDSDEAGVVVIWGERIAEGTTETIAAALPYIVADGEVRLEPFVGTVTWELPAEHGETVPADATVAAIAPAGDVLIAIDDDLRVAHTEPGPEQGTIRATLPLSEVEPGTHTLTTVSSTPNGLVAGAILVTIQ